MFEYKYDLSGAHESLVYHMQQCLNHVFEYSICLRIISQRLYSLQSLSSMVVHSLKCNLCMLSNMEFVLSTKVNTIVYI